MKNQFGKASSLTNKKIKRFGKASSLEKDLIKELDKAKDDTLPYSVLYKKHRADLVKKIILKLEEKGKIQIFPERKKGDLGFVTYVKLIKNTLDCEYVHSIIKKFNAVSSIDAKVTIIHDNLYEPATRYQVICPHVFDFLKNVLLDKKFLEKKNIVLHTFGQILETTKSHSLLKTFDEMKKDEKFVNFLESIVLDVNEKNSTSLFYATKLLILLNPKKAIDSLFEILSRGHIFVHWPKFVDLIMDAHKQLPNSTEYVMKKCDEFLDKWSETERATETERAIIVKNILGRLELK